ncbi:MAG: hypothetical protein JXB48_11880 [Candidatus Latescibacteria bacterium]|nr:hypothetical protein [Candidatus Latescibacterota bacterium]
MLFIESGRGKLHISLENQNIVKYIRTGYYFFLIAVMLLFGTGITFSVEPAGLEKGIDYYKKGRYDEALNEFNIAVSNDFHNPLAYYYAARIRLVKQQYRRAEENILAALRDSSDFSDAKGLLAFTRLKKGDINQALIDWTNFISAAGKLDDTKVTVQSIILPEEYRLKLAKKQQALIEEKERIAAVEKARADSLALAQQKEEELKNTEIAVTDTSVTEDNDAEATVETETTVDLKKRISDNIRHGIYGIIAAGISLVAFIAGFFVWLRKRMRTQAEITFNEEIKQILDEKAQSDERFEHDEARAMHEYKAISREINNVDKSSAEQSSRQMRAVKLPDFENAENKEYKKENVVAPVAGRYQTMTEEVKALVTRMFREGHSVTEIASAADLTKTEVELILAVRARRMEQLIHDVTDDGEEVMAAGQMSQAISELTSEGHSTREIARKLDISTSEVKLAISLINLRKERRQ